MLVVVVIGVLACWPLPTYQGVDYRVRRLSIPAYVKAMEFITRHWRYRELAQRIVAESRQRDPVRAIYEWTRRHIRPRPSHFPIVDDHIWHIIVRGYGSADQQADVFTTLCVYVGFPAFWRFESLTPKGRKYIWSFVRLESGWGIFNVAAGWVFDDDLGRLLTVKQLKQMPGTFWDQQPEKQPASAYIRHLEDVRPPHPLRPHLQMPWRRLRYELKHFILSRFKS